MNILLEERCLFDHVLSPEKVKKCLSRMSGKLSRTVLRRGRESNLLSLVEFTSDRFIGVLKKNNIEISMDGKGQALDNIYVERLWRSLKYEDIYIKSYGNMMELRNGISKYSISIIQRDSINL